MKISHLRKFIFSAFFLMLSACSSDQKDLIDLGVNGPGRGEIDRDKIGVNNFFNQSNFGTTEIQFQEIKSTLGLNYVRILASWDNAVQPSPSEAPNYGLLDEIISSIPSGVDVLIVLTHVPDWMTNPANWINGNPRLTFVDRWVKPTVNRYKNRTGVIGWEVWNEPDFPLLPADRVLELELPENYIELLAAASPAIRSLDPTRLVVLAATRSIQQNYPVALNYNRRMRDLGARDYVDIWNVHYYGKQFENVVKNNGVAEFLSSISKPIWITESGEQGPNNQLKYAETTFPYLTKQIKNIDRIYWYEYASSAPLETNYGLKTNDLTSPVSDLYIHLRDNK
jgi:hypothetical protein